jgi:hypothetical protein
LLDLVPTDDSIRSTSWRAVWYSDPSDPSPNFDLYLEQFDVSDPTSSYCNVRLQHNSQQRLSVALGAVLKVLRLPDGGAALALPWLADYNVTDASGSITVISGTGIMGVDSMCHVTFWLPTAPITAVAIDNYGSLLIGNSSQVLACMYDLANSCKVQHCASIPYSLAHGSHSLC